MPNMTRGFLLSVLILLPVILGQLAASYPYPARYNNPRESNDNWKYPYYNTQLNRSPNQNRNNIARSNSEQRGREDWSHRYQEYASEAKYYNAYDRKKLQAAETALVLDHIAEANARPTSKIGK